MSPVTWVWHPSLLLWLCCLKVCVKTQFSISGLRSCHKRKQHLTCLSSRWATTQASIAGPTECEGLFAARLTPSVPTHSVLEEAENRGLTAVVVNGTFKHCKSRIWHVIWKSEHWLRAQRIPPCGNKPERQHFLFFFACLCDFGNSLGVLNNAVTKGRSWKMTTTGDSLYRLLLHSRHRILSPSGKKPAPTSETEHWEQVKHGWCHWRSSNEMYFPPPKP